MKLTIPQEVIKILITITNAKFECYVVGGAVRDILMNKPVVDWDYTTNATPEEILAIFPDAYYNNAFGTVGIPSEDPNIKPHEVTTFRHEFGYSDSRRPDKVVWGKTLEEDLKRRDFTINAMALSLKDKKSHDFDLIDPFAGQKDLKNKTIRAVGNAHERFSEDALRMLRAIRIASEINFQIEEKTFQAIQDNKSLILKIAKERVRDELMKILASPNPYSGYVYLKETGLMAEILPELEKTFGVEQKSPGRHHIYDVGTHSLMSLKNCKSTDPVVRFATLIHDIGKPLTYKKLPNGVITFYNHEVIGARIAKRIAERLRFSKKDSDLLWKLVRYHQFTVDEHQTDSAIRRFIRKVGIENIEPMLALRVADRLGGGARETSWRLEEFKERLVEAQKEPFTVRELKVSGIDVMKELKLTPGPKVGEILNTLFKEVEEKRISNEKEALLSRMREMS